MNHPTERIAHTTAFVTPVVEHWLEQELFIVKVSGLLLLLRRLVQMIKFALVYILSHSLRWF